MKQVFSILLLFSFIAYACSNSSEEVRLSNGEEVGEMLAHKWEPTHMETANTRTEISKPQIVQLTFHKNGTFGSSVKNGVIETKGKWTYNQATHMLNRNVDGKEFSSRILKLTESQVILSEYFLLNDKIADSTVYTYKKI